MRVGWLLPFLASCGAPDDVQWAREPFPDEPSSLASLHARVVTSNSGDDTLSLLDPERPGSAQRLNVGFNPVELEGPHHLSVAPDAAHLYLNLSLAVKGSGTGPHGSHGAGNLPGYVLKLDTATGRAVSWVQVDANPGDNTLSADGRTLYVTHYDLLKWVAAAGSPEAGRSRLLLVDTESMTVRERVELCPAAHGVRLSRDETRAFATCGSDELAVVDLTASPPSVERVALPGGKALSSCRSCAYALGVAPDDSVWVSCLGSSDQPGAVHVFDSARAAFDTERSVAFAGSPMFAAFAGEAGDFVAYVPEQGLEGDFINVLGAGSSERLPLDASDCVRAHMLHVSPNGGPSHLVCEGDHVGPGSLVWLDLSTLSVVGSRPIGVFPDAVAFVPEERREAK